MPLTTSLLSVFIFAFTLSIGAVLTPGPVSTAIVSQSPRRGWLAGPLVAAGHALSEGVVITLVAVGLTSVLAVSGLQHAVAVLGGLLLLWMGLGLLWGAWRNTFSLPKAGEGTASMSNSRLVGLGVLATISNPFWYAWWMTAAPGYLAQVSSLGLAAIAMFYLGHISADFAWDTFLSSVVGGGRRWMTNRFYRIIILVCGAYLIYLAGAFLLQGLRGLIG